MTRKLLLACASLLGAVLLCIVSTARAATITYAPSPAVVGQSVTLTGQAHPNSSMSFYLGSIHVGVAKADAQGRYTHTFTVPGSLRTGEEKLAGGCDTCGNGWTTIQMKVSAVKVAPAGESASGSSIVERIKAAYRGKLRREPTESEVAFHQGLRGQWSPTSGNKELFEASLQMFEKYDKQYPDIGRIVWKAWAEIPQWLPDVNWMKNGVGQFQQMEHSEVRFRAEIKKLTLRWSFDKGLENELKAHTLLRGITDDASSALYRATESELDSGRAQGINGLVEWLQSNAAKHLVKTSLTAAMARPPGGTAQPKPRPPAACQDYPSQPGCEQGTAEDEEHWRKEEEVQKAKQAAEQARKQALSDEIQRHLGAGIESVDTNAIAGQPFAMRVKTVPRQLRGLRLRHPTGKESEFRFEEATQTWVVNVNAVSALTKFEAVVIGPDREDPAKIARYHVVLVTVIPAPAIDSIDPVSNQIGADSVRIRGRALDQATRVEIPERNSRSAFVKATVISANELLATFPEWGTSLSHFSQQLGVTTPGGVAWHNVISPSQMVDKNRLGHAEYCYPAVGNACLGFGREETSAATTPWGGAKAGCSADVNGWRACWIVPGSIKHDTCCIINPSGKRCGGPGTDGKPAEENNHNGACVAEWQDAFDDVAWGRAWTGIFNTRKAADLTPVLSNRTAQGFEMRESTRYCAPDGHELREQRDEVFCCSGRAVNKKCAGGTGGPLNFTRSGQAVSRVPVILGDPRKGPPPAPDRAVAQDTQSLQPTSSSQPPAAAKQAKPAPQPKPVPQPTPPTITPAPLPKAAPATESGPKACNPELPRLWQPGCVDASASGPALQPKPTPQPVPPTTTPAPPPKAAPQLPSALCDENRPRYAQPGCVEPPSAPQKPGGGAPQKCDERIPRYAQPGCIP